MNTIELWALTARFATEAEAMERARQMQLADPHLIVIVRDGNGREIVGRPSLVTGKMVRGEVR